jgi:hypothetical protein
VTWPLTHGKIDKLKVLVETAMLGIPILGQNHKAIDKQQLVVKFLWSSEMN